MGNRFMLIEVEDGGFDFGDGVVGWDRFHSRFLRLFLPDIFFDEYPEFFLGIEDGVVVQVDPEVVKRQAEEQTWFTFGLFNLIFFKFLFINFSLFKFSLVDKYLAAVQVV